MKYNPNLDSTRACAALAVIAFHWDELLPFGWIGVQFFFVLSGYLITDILVRSKESAVDLRGYLKSFYLRRVLRLVPLYLLYIGLWSVIYLISGVPKELPSYCIYLFTYTINIARMIPGFVESTRFSHLWSLASEWQFYAIWPFIVWWIPKKHWIGFLCLLAATAPLFRGLTWMWAAHIDWGTLPQRHWLEKCGSFVYNAPWSTIDAFAFGGLLVSPRVLALFTKPAFIVTTFAALLAGGVAVLARSSPDWKISVFTLGYASNMPHCYQSIWGYSLLNAAAAVALALVVSRGESGIYPLNGGVLRYLGKISYGLYVWHLPVTGFLLEFLLLRRASNSIYGLAMFAVALAITIGLAHTSFFYFENVFLKMKGKVRA